MMKETSEHKSLIESDKFPFEVISKIAERESWRKEVYRPIYYLHKWWAKRLGTVFRAILLSSLIDEGSDLIYEFYRKHSFADKVVFDPFMGSGTTIGEAHKLGLTALGRDINPVAFESVRSALGPIDIESIEDEFKKLENSVGRTIKNAYKSRDSKGEEADVLYFFWVMVAKCPHCSKIVDLFSNRILAKNAYPKRVPDTKVVCPDCGFISVSKIGERNVVCSECQASFNPEIGNIKNGKVTCDGCGENFKLINYIRNHGKKPDFRLHAKLVLTQEGEKEYLRATADDINIYNEASEELERLLHYGGIKIPKLSLADGYNTNQAINYGFRKWSDFFNDRQLLLLSLLQSEIMRIKDLPTREIFLTLFSGILEFNNMFASYKGEGTGAVRHMFYNHILKPERTPIEANIWGTSKSSGSFSTLYKGRLKSLIKYRERPTEVNLNPGGAPVVSSERFTGHVDTKWPIEGAFKPREIYLSCGTSSDTRLPPNTIDLVVTDPPFFNNVNYSELADFFYAWQQLTYDMEFDYSTTRNRDEVQDLDPESFSKKLAKVFKEAGRILKPDGLLIFTYHQSNPDGWVSLMRALIDSGFFVINSHPVKSEMSVAAPKSQASEPIQIDNILVCKKQDAIEGSYPSIEDAISMSKEKIHRLESSGFNLSKNDEKVVFYGQALCSLRSLEDTSILHKIDSYE